jgi:hypothetical protein
MKRALFVGIVLFIFSCEPRQGQQVQEVPPTASVSTSMNELVAKEVIQATSYTYVKGDQKGKEVWIAILKRDVEVGKTYYYGQAMEMKGFNSKELERTFDSILFLEGIFDSPDGNNKAQVASPHNPSKNKKSGAPRQEMNIQHKEGEIEIGELYKNKESLASKKIKVRGVVTKFNPGIMDRNWVHIQDGTGGTTSFDLTITTNDQVQVGTIAVFEGAVAVDKDFGHGYKYDLILEEANLLNKKSDTKIN